MFNSEDEILDRPVYIRLMCSLKEVRVKRKTQIEVQKAALCDSLVGVPENKLRF